MPVHTYECKKCGKRKDEFVSYPMPDLECACGGVRKVVYDWGKCNNIEVFQPYWEDNLGDKPVYIESKQHLAKECKARGLMANRLRDGYRSYI
jgi:hypothetical protein